MTGSPEQSLGDRWRAALTELTVGHVFREHPADDMSSLRSTSSRLNDFSKLTLSTNAQTLVELFRQVDSFRARPDDWNQPYGPMMRIGDERTVLPSDLTADDIEVLSGVAALIPDALLRSRTYDVLAIRSTGRQRVEWYRLAVESITNAKIVVETWYVDAPQWDRGISIARRFAGEFGDLLGRLTSKLVSAVLSSDLTQHPNLIAEILFKHDIARNSSQAIAMHLRAMSSEAGSEQARTLLSSSAKWADRAGDRREAADDRLAIVKSLVDEADSVEGNPARSAHLLERALGVLRSVPRSIRTERGLASATEDLAGKIRAAGAATLGTMGVIRSDSVDLSNVRRHSIETVSGKAPLEALIALAALMNFANYEEEKSNAERLLAEHPLQTLFGNVTYSRDGRVIHRTGTDDHEVNYGISSATWHQMIQAYEFRIQLFVQGSIAPAWASLTNEHLLAVTDFVRICEMSSIVPPDRSNLIGQALYYGWGGDFLTAAQLLAPQIENIVRLHMGNAGEPTSAIDQSGIEREIGISALMARPIADQIFGPDIAYEIRALFCGPLGPNLRNEFAHGLISDRAINSATALYCWYFIFRLVYVPFWNDLHDAPTADAFEPSEHHDDGSGFSGEASGGDEGDRP